jgi:hypothetical protein
MRRDAVALVRKGRGNRQNQLGFSVSGMSPPRWPSVLTKPIIRPPLIYAGYFGYPHTERGVESAPVGEIAALASFGWSARLGLIGRGGVCRHSNVLPGEPSLQVVRDIREMPQ